MNHVILGPILLGCREEQAHDDPADWKSLPVHRDEEQVQLDVNRSFVYYPNNESEKQLNERKQELSSLIVEVLRRYPSLCYFQGYHDIVQVLLLVLGRELSTEATIRLSLLRIRDFMLPAMSPAISHLRLLPSILYVANRRLYQRVAPTQPFFALAATLTMYAHDIQEYGDIARLFDFLLAGEAVLPIYFYAAIILDREKELLEVPEDEPEMLHFTLSKLPQNLDIENLIVLTRDMMENYPPEKLPSWRWVSSNSVLKTTRDPATLARQSIDYGEQLFQQQAKALNRQQMIEHLYKTARLRLWTYRRPAMYAAAVAVGALAVWIGTRPQFRHRIW